jgi:hypothetical protein
VQSIAPIRKEGLDAFRDDRVVVEGPWFSPLEPADAQEAAHRLERQLTPADAQALADRAPLVATSLELASSGVQIHPRSGRRTSSSELGQL